MEKALPPLVSITKLVQRAELHPGGALPPNSHRSYPIPSAGAEGLRVAFLYSPAAIVEPQAGLQIYPPTYVAFFQAETGMFEELKSVTPAEFGLNVALDQPLGSYLTPAHRLSAEFLTKQVRLFQDYDLLMGAFAASLSVVSEEVKNGAIEFKSLFPQVAEAPLRPCYQSLGQHFFSWISRITV
jgi:hypothetical protein